MNLKEPTNYGTNYDGQELLDLRKFMDHHTSPFRWYRFQNSTTVKDIDLKFYMIIVLEKLEDPMQVFLPESVHK
jgi:hypothetical protein